jgi:hypothetical protein
MTMIMKIDLVGPKSRGLAVGLNEFAGISGAVVAVLMCERRPMAKPT